MSNPLIPQAERMYIRENKICEHIAKTLGVAKSTVYDWRKKGDWDRRKTEMETSVEFITETLMGFLAEDVQFVLNAAYLCGLEHMETAEVSNWIFLSFKKP